MIFINHYRYKEGKRDEVCIFRMISATHSD